MARRRGAKMRRTESHSSTSGTFRSVERCSSRSAENWYRKRIASEAKLTMRLPSVAAASFLRVSFLPTQPPVPHARAFQLPLQLCKEDASR